MKSIFDYFTKTASNAASAMNEDEELAEEGVYYSYDRVEKLVIDSLKKCLERIFEDGWWN